MTADAGHRAEPRRETAHGVVLADILADLREPLMRYAQTMRAANEARSELTLAKVQYADIKWHAIDRVARELAF